MKSSDKTTPTPYSKLLYSIHSFTLQVYQSNIKEDYRIKLRKSNALSLPRPVKIGLYLPKDLETYEKCMSTPVHMADFIPNISVNLWVLVFKFGENNFKMITCPCAKNGSNRVNTSLSPDIHNIKIFKFLVGFIPHYSVNI